MRRVRPILRANFAKKRRKTTVRAGRLFQTRAGTCVVRGSRVDKRRNHVRYDRSGAALIVRVSGRHGLFC